jgi:hypothetical protein
MIINENISNVPVSTVCRLIEDTAHSRYPISALTRVLGYNQGSFQGCGKRMANTLFEGEI